MVIDKLFYEDVIHRVESLMVFKNIQKDPVIEKLIKLCKLVAYESRRDSVNEVYYDFIFELTSKAEQLGLSGNILGKYVAYAFLQDENSFSLACENNLDVKKSSLYGMVCKDMNFLNFPKLTDFSVICDTVGYGENISSYKPVTPVEHMNIEQIMIASSSEKGVDELIWYYSNMGVSIMSTHSSFTIDDELNFHPINDNLIPNINDIVGFKAQKDEIIRNTTDFINGEHFENVVLSGDSGMSKSPIVRGISHSFFDRNLRLIELHKNQLHLIPALVDKLSFRGKKFIIFIDKLDYQDFVENETYIRCLFHNSTTSNKPKNTVLYITTDSISPEKIDNNKINAEFSLNVDFPTLTETDYFAIVFGLLKKAKIAVPEDFLRAQSKIWGATHSIYSYNSAKQFVNYIIRESKKI